MHKAGLENVARQGKKVYWSASTFEFLGFIFKPEHRSGPAYGGGFRGAFSSDTSGISATPKTPGPKGARGKKKKKTRKKKKRDSSMKFAHSSRWNHEKYIQTAATGFF